jgi:ABC-type uncharacterized transport system permease subunit
MSPNSSDSPSGAVDVNHGIQAWGFIALFGFIIPAMALQSLWTAGLEGSWLAVAALLLAPLAWWLLGEARIRIQASERGVEARPLWGRPTSLPWDGVRSIRYRKHARVLEIHGPGLPGGILRVSLLRENVQALARFIMERVPDEALEGEARTLFRPRG